MYNYKNFHSTFILFFFFNIDVANEKQNYKEKIVFIRHFINEIYHTYKNIFISSFIITKLIIIIK
jgi:hypothetical protein